MDSLRLVFYGFAGFCLGLIAVATGGFRDVAIIFAIGDPQGFDRAGVVISIAFGVAMLLLAVIFASAGGAPDDERPD